MRELELSNDLIPLRVAEIGLGIQVPWFLCPCVSWTFPYRVCPTISENKKVEKWQDIDLKVDRSKSRRKKKKKKRRKKRSKSLIVEALY